jgi:hypothetical protein
MNVGYFDESWLFGNEEDVFLQHEQVALHGLEIGFDTWVTITTKTGVSKSLSSG